MKKRVRVDGRRRRAAIRALAVASLLAAGAFWVWPTPYRYVWVGSRELRISRRNDHAEKWTGHGWVRASDHDFYYAGVSSSVTEPTGPALWWERLRQLFRHP